MFQCFMYHNKYTRLSTISYVVHCTSNGNNVIPISQRVFFGIFSSVNYTRVYISFGTLSCRTKQSSLYGYIVYLYVIARAMISMTMHFIKPAGKFLRLDKIHTLLSSIYYQQQQQLLLLLVLPKYTFLERNFE